MRCTVKTSGTIAIIMSPLCIISVHYPFSLSGYDRSCSQVNKSYLASKMNLLTKPKPKRVFDYISYPARICTCTFGWSETLKFTAEFISSNYVLWI